MEQFVLNGNNIDLLKNYPDNYFDAIVTDPPYGLGKEPNAEDVMKGWIEKGYHEVSGSGFMGKEWDAFIPQPIFWKEVFRVLKHGGHVVAFYGTRTYDWGVMAMRFAGFEVRDCIQWLYGSGFPKSYNVGKGIEGKIMLGDSNPSKFKNLQGKVSEQVLGFANSDFSSGHKIKVYDKTKIDVDYQSTQGKQWEGWGSALKPSNEPIVLARKPLEKGLSIAENVLKWGTGGINIDGCRIGHNEEQKFTNREQRKEGWNMDNCGFDSTQNITASANPQGRFPANLILTHHHECECKGLKKVKGTSGQLTDGDGEDRETKFGQIKSNKVTTYYGSEETIEDWDCHEDCPIRIMDEQSGISISGKNLDEKGSGGIWQKSSGLPVGNQYGDKGGASRFFKQVNYSKSEIHYCYLCDKANKNELWKNNYNNVLNAVRNLKSTSQMKEPIVQENVTESLKLKADQLVRSVANPCDLCVTNFVQEVVEISNLDSNQEISQVMRDFIQNYKKCTLLQSLVFYVEMMDNIDTTPTTKNLLKLFGSALIAIENYTKKDIKGKEEQKSEQTRFLYQPKASKSERNKGLSEEISERKTPMSGRGQGGLKCKICNKWKNSGNPCICENPDFEEVKFDSKPNFNGHPTVKPVKLMQYLVRLITPPNGKVLDPFCGSGTTGIACKLEGFEFIGLEQDAEYCKIAQSRIDNYEEEIEEIVYITNKEGEKVQITQTSLF
jgi:site-specific DNA-methyltransferase (adenine-specific)